jgi:hypothetical protein
MRLLNQSEQACSPQKERVSIPPQAAAGGEDVPPRAAGDDNVVATPEDKQDERTIMDDTTQTRDDPLPSVTVHNTTWHQDNIATLQDIDGPVLQRQWHIRDEGGNLFGHTLDGRSDDNRQALEMS